MGKRLRRQRAVILFSEVKNPSRKRIFRTRSMLTLHRRRTDGWACGGNSRRAGVRADGGGTGWGGGRDASAPWPAAPATLPRRPGRRHASSTRKRRASFSPLAKPNPVDGGSERAIDASAQSTPETRARRSAGVRTWSTCAMTDMLRMLCFLSI